MMSTLAFSIGLGLVASLLALEWFGWTVAGWVVPGYLAAFFDQPASVLAAVLIGLITAGFVRGIARFTILFGRRRTILTLLIGTLIGAVLFVPDLTYLSEAIRPPSEFDRLRPIGFIIPGLIGLWIDRQGSLMALGSLGILTGVVRLLLLLFVTPEGRP